MKFFLDTAIVDEIRWGAEAGLIDGVTTNPSLVSQVAGDKASPKELMAEICRAVDGPVSAEVVAVDKEGMLRQGRDLAKIADNIVVKVPLIEEGLMACRTFAAEGIKVNVTLCFSASQALLAAKAGASYISPFIGRIDDISGDGMELIGQIRTIYDNYDFQTEILAASIRHPRHIVECALVGADVATMPTKVLKQLITHPLTDKGLDGFLSDWAKLGKDRGAL